MRSRVLPLMLLMAMGAAAHAGEGEPRPPKPPQPVVRVPRAPRPPAAPVRVFLIGGESETSDTLFAVPAGARLDLENFSGEIAVTGWERNALRLLATHEEDTRVRVEVGPVDVVVRAEKTIEVPDFSRSRTRHVARVNVPAEVEYQLMVPRSMGLRLTGINSEILVANVDGDVSAEAINGTVTLCGGVGSIRASSVNGEVEVVGAWGPVEATSISGDVLVAGAQGRIRAESVSGSVFLSDLTSKSVEASTTSGDVQFAGAGGVVGTYRLSTHSGSVVVLLPERPDVAVNVSTYSGGFESSFPIRVKELKRGKQFRFTLGEGRSELDLESFSGDIRIMRHGEAGREDVELRRDLLNRVREANERTREAAKEALERARERLRERERR